MFKAFVTSKILFEDLLAIARIVTGIITIKFGWGIFNPDHMKGNIDWLTDINFPFPFVMAYLGKISELIGGIS